MSKREMIEPGKVQPTYSGFVILRLNEIWASWTNNDPEQALRLALHFAATLVPKKIKKKLRHDVEVITKEFNAAYKVESVDFYTSHLVRNRLARAIAIKRLLPFLSKLSDLLDEWGYYEIPSRRLKAKDFKELEKVES